MRQDDFTEYGSTPISATVGTDMEVRGAAFLTHEVLTVASLA